MSDPTHNDDVRRFVATLCDDPVAFVRAMWADRRLDRYAPLGDVELDMVRFLFDGPQKKVGLGPRSMGKTWIVVAMKPLWRLLQDPDHKTMIVSKSEEKAVETIHVMKLWLRDVWFLRHLYPRGQNKRWSTQKMDVQPAEPSRSPSIAAYGIDGQLEGGRAHEVLADDVETDLNTRTRDARRILADRVGEFSDIASYGHQEVTYVGTPHHEESLYHKILPERDYEVRTWPIVYPSNEQRKKIIGLAPLIADRLDKGQALPGEPTMPHRFGEEAVIRKQAEGRHRFAQQHMLIADLGDEDRYPLRLADLVLFPVLHEKAPISIAWGKNNGQGQSTEIEDIPCHGLGDDTFHAPIWYESDWKPYQRKAMKVDPSGSGADDTCYAYGGLLNGFLYVMDVKAVKAKNGASYEAAEEIVKAARAADVREIDVEKNFAPSFPAMLESTVSRFRIPPGGKDDRGNPYPTGWSAIVTATHSTGQKERRIIDTISPVAGHHRLVISRSVAANEAWQRQFTRITVERNCLDEDDELDAFAGLVALFTDDLHVNPDDAAKRDREEIDEASVREAQRFFNELGNDPEPTWHTIP